MFDRIALIAAGTLLAAQVWAQDVPALLKAAVERLGGKGGGRGNVAQGGGERLDLVDEVLARAAEAVRSRA